MASENGTNDDGHGNTNRWKTWGEDVYERVHRVIGNQVGNRDNAHYLPALAKKVMKDIEHFPLWSCVVRDKFGYGRVPASSAPVESEFNKLKTHVLRNETLPMRVDSFLDVHIKYTGGRAKILGAKLVEDEQSEKNLSEMVDTCNELPECLVTNTNTDLEKDDDDQDYRTEQQPVNSVSTKVQCPACANNDKPGGAHRCVICNVPVHALDSCSKAVNDSDEGYGQGRLCLSCHSAKSVDFILASRHEDEWGGEVAAEKTKNKQKTAKYLGMQKHKIKEQLHFGQNKKLLIMKNGSHGTLRAQTVDGKKVYVIHTCPFDSIYQVILAAFCDRPDLRRMVSIFLAKH